MKFFTKDLWRRAQNAALGDHRILEWQQAESAYRAQLFSLRARLRASELEFFAEADVHDGELLELAINDGSRPAPQTEVVPAWRSSNDNPVKARLAVMDARDEFVWQLSYQNVRRALIDYPSSDPLFHSEGEGFGDWGFHELSDAGDGFLCHEILFATGSTLLFEFKDVAVSRVRRSQPFTSR